jgi:hypothetical protein
MGRRAIAAVAILGNWDEHHFLDPAGDLAQDQDIADHLPGTRATVGEWPWVMLAFGAEGKDILR